MKVLSVSLQNFASYKSLEFSFENKGLALIHGPNGAGKSTLCDAIPWVLFGRTAKNGAVDEILSWPGDKMTVGTIHTDTISVTRTRGPKGNDLHFSDTPGIIKRGKDVTDTQRLINQHLGFDCDFYLTAAYFHEFSQTASFFTATAKNRRLLCEQLVDLSLAKKLQTGIDAQKKALKPLSMLPAELNAAVSRKHELEASLAEEEARAASWAAKQEQRAVAIALKSENFDTEKRLRTTHLVLQSAKFVANKRIRVAAIQARLDNPAVCSECGAPKAQTSHERALIQKELQTEKKAANFYEEELERLKASENAYAQQLEAIALEINPHHDSVQALEASLAKASQKVWTLTHKVDEYLQKSSDLELLAEAVEHFRSISVKNTISTMETSTNTLLSDHFDAEIRVQFEVEGADKVEVSILKDGNSCSYTQLSKGQRQMLKLCFAVSAMRTIATHHGIGLNTIAFDEALDGLSETMKAKAFGLLDKLSSDYETVLIVDHSESLKALFSNRYRVELQDGGSVINEEA